MDAFKLGLITAILFGIAVATDWSLPDRLILTLVAVLILAWIWNRFSLQRVGLRRSLSLDRVRAGEWISETLTLKNHALWPKLWIEVRDLSSLPGYQAGAVVRLGVKGSATWVTRGRCERRGRFRLGPVALVSGDPLGLFRSVRTLPVTHELIVYPPRIDVSQIPLPLANMTGGPSASVRGFHAAHTISGVREYAEGDPLNRISWSATARLGRMMVKEFDPDPSSDMWILLDLGLDEHQTPGHQAQVHGLDDESIEAAVALAGSVAERALDQGRRVGLIVNRTMPIRVDADSSQRQWFRIFEVLAVASSFGHRSLTEAISADSRRFTRNSGLLVVTTSPSSDWVAAARALIMRHVPVTAVLVGHAEDLADPGMAILKSNLLQARAQVAEHVTGVGMVDHESHATRVA